MHARTRRPLPPRRAGQADPLPGQVQGLRLSEFVLTLNAGSSSVKYSLFPCNGDFATPWQAGQVENLGVGGLGHAHALQQLLAKVGGVKLVAIGHRIVHGGVLFDAPALIDEAVEAAIVDLQPLAPLHQPHNLAGIRAARAAFPGVPQVACFDTAFHRTMPEVHQRFALPQALHDAGVKRYGFHGLSYESIVGQLRASEPTQAAGRVVVAHLGNGASMCALHDGRSVSTTMSFSPLDGLTMGTRCGRIDAAVVLHLLQQRGMSADAVSQLLHKGAGLLGLSGLSSDMRELMASPAPAARLALDHFVESAVREVAVMTAALRGIDALVFTGGIGENAVEMRTRIVAGAAWLGMSVDEDANRRAPGRISRADSAVAVHVLRTNEEAVIARHAAAVAG